MHKQSFQIGIQIMQALNISSSKKSLGSPKRAWRMACLVYFVVMATISKRRRNAVSILTSFLISKRNEPAYSSTCKIKAKRTLLILHLRKIEAKRILFIPQIQKIEAERTLFIPKIGQIEAKLSLFIPQIFRKKKRRSELCSFHKLDRSKRSEVCLFHKLEKSKRSELGLFQK